jgi:2-succinyl-6-hydroxy-2,4-cyclohexadiene-1-carboxylate synthase
MEPGRARRGCVLLHGFTGSPAAWDEVRAALAPHGPVFCPAVAGHAVDSGQATDFESEVDRLARAITVAGLERSQLCGYSLGARLALGLSVRYPALFTRVTLIGVHPGLPEHGSERRERAADDERWAQLAERSVAEFIAQWREQPLFATQRALPPAKQAALDRRRSVHDGAALGRALRALSLARMPDWRPHLPQLTMPVQLIVGELDTKFVELAREIAPRIPAATISVVPCVGHDVVLERPAAIIAALLD